MRKTRAIPNVAPGNKKTTDRRNLPAIRPSNALAPTNDYRVGPGCPPREYQFKKGQSGNPLGAKIRKRSIVPDLKAMLERALRQKMPKKEGEKVLTKAAAGIQRLVDQFAQGDRNGRRDLIQVADLLGVDLTAGASDALQESVTKALSQNDRDLIKEFFEHLLAEHQAQRHLPGS